MVEARRLLPLGTGSVMMGSGRSASGYLLEVDGVRILVDLGPGSLLRLAEAGVDRASIDYVVLSHFHPDHHADLLGLLFLRRNPAAAARLHRLRIYAPPGIRRILRAWDDVYGSWVEHPPHDVQEIGEGAFEVGPVRVRAFPAMHTIPSFCYRFELSGGTALAYSGDTEVCEGVIDACRDTAFCWLECSFPDAEATAGHLTPRGIRTVLERARPRVAGLTHFYPPMEEWLRDEAAFEACFGDLETSVVVLRDLQEVPL